METLSDGCSFSSSRVSLYPQTPAKQTNKTKQKNLTTIQTSAKGDKGSAFQYYPLGLVWEGLAFVHIFGNLTSLDCYCYEYFILHKLIQWVIIFF